MAVSFEKRHRVNSQRSKYNVTSAKSLFSFSGCVTCTTRHHVLNLVLFWWHQPRSNLPARDKSSMARRFLNSRILGTYLNSFFCFFSVRLWAVLRGHSVVSSPPQRPMTSDFEGFSIQDFILYIYFPILILEKEPVFSLLNVQC